MTHPSPNSWQPELQLGLKLLLLSAGLAGGIRFLGPSLPLPPTTPVVLAIIVSPTLILAGLFTLRWYRHKSP